jgi:ADP-heptose:LPS heptosyltransferase
MLGRAPGASEHVTWLGDGRPPAIPDGARILLIRPDHLGDVLFLGPALRRLRAAWPAAEVTLLVGPWAAALAERLPGGAAVETLNFPWFNRRREPRWRTYGRLWASARRLRGRFDAALVLRDDDGWGAWLAALAGVPLRLGHDRPEVRPFLSHALPAALCPTHTAAANIALVTALGGRAEVGATPDTDPLILHLTEDDRQQAARLLDGVPGVPGVAGDGPLAVHPGAGAEVKLWRATALGEVIGHLARPDETVILTGSAGEAELTAAVARQAGRPTLDLAGRTDLGTLMAVLARCRLALGPDSGPLHLAAALGVPTVHLYGPADEARFGPWGPAPAHRVVRTALPCAPCGRLDWTDPENHPCVRVIEVSQVVAAARLCRPPSARL